MLFGLIEIMLFLCGLAFCIFLPVIALIDILKSNFEGSNKLIWVVVVVGLNFFGAILYFLIGRNQKI